MILAELCRKLVAIESTPGTGNFEAVKFIEEIARSWGLTVEIEEALQSGIPQANILVRRASTKTKQRDEVHFISRLSTRDPGHYGEWTKTGANPFHMSTDGEWAYGLGVAESKADFLCRLLALKEFADEKTSCTREPVVVGTFGLEDCSGAIKLIRRNRQKIKFAVISAPTRMVPSDRGPGFALVEISVPFSSEENAYRNQHDLAEGSVSQTKMFHAPELISDGLMGNPILLALDYLAKLPRGIALMSFEGGSAPTNRPDHAVIEVDIVDGIFSMVEKLVRLGDCIKHLNSAIKKYQDTKFDPPYSTIGLGMARTHADHVVLAGYCRLLPIESDSDASRNIYDSWLKKLRSDCISAGAEFRILDYKPPFLSSLSEPIFNEFKSVSFDRGLMGESWVAAPGCTEANVLSRLNIPCVVIGPGESTMAASASNERINLNATMKAQEFYLSVMKRMCL